MLKPELKAMGDAVVEAVRGYVRRSVEALNQRLDGLEARLAAVPAGRDGRDGQAGRPGEKGADGKDGRDGLGFDDLAVEFDGERTVTFKFQRGEVVKAFAVVLPTVIDRGVFKEGKAYQRGDAVSFGGSLWIAQADTAEGKPDAGEASCWRMAVKRGRDGKDGKDGAAGQRGPQGEKGHPGLNGRTYA